MSPGACRALASTLLTLAASVSLASPVAANTQNLNERSIVTYTVDPDLGVVDVDIVLQLNNGSNSAAPADEWGPIVVEERVTPTLPAGFEVDRFEDLPGHWRAMYVSVPRIAAGENVNLRIRYALDASADQSDAARKETPARVDAGYLYLCLPGQDTDSGKVALRVKGARSFTLTQSGTVLNPTNQGLESDFVRSPRELFTCVEGTREDSLAADSFPGPADRTVILQAWPSQDGWLSPALSNAKPALDDIHAFLRLDIPGDDPLVIREAPPRSLGGYASAHDTPGVVQLDEAAGVIDPDHELAHAWFSTDDFIELWLREGMAQWTASAMGGAACAPVEANPGELDLAEWQVVRPISDPDTIEATLAAQEAAACGIVSAVAGRMGDDRWREVLAALLQAETKYIGSAGPGAAATTVVNYREWLDAVDERGLVPAIKARPDFDGTTEGLDLDFAQDLLRAFQVPTDDVELARRSETRARYHAFLLDAAPLGAPLAVRKSMDDWDFDRADQEIEKSYEVLNALREADAQLPAAGLISFVQPAFESAHNANALDDVLETALTLLREATEVFEPLRELGEASPEGWALPNAVRLAIEEQRFDDILGAVGPALSVVQQVSAADAALPSAGLLEKYKTRYETSTTEATLQDLAAEAATDNRNAVRVGSALDALRSEVGDWQIPAAVTDPLARRDLAGAVTIIDDARAVVNAAQQADLALPEAQLSAALRPRFEAVVSASEMAALRAEAETRRDEAVTVGDAMRSLAATVGDWQLPAIVTDPIEARDFAAAALTAAAAQDWVEKAFAADQILPDIGLLERIREDFESAASLQELEAGAEFADKWSQAATKVTQAIEANKQPRDMLAVLGLWGTDIQPIIDEALDAVVAGQVDLATQKAAEAIATINGGSGNGSLRLAGIVFLTIAILGVLGLWVMLRREAGPPWARQSRPHWIESGDDRWRKPKNSKSGRPARTDPPPRARN